MIEAIRERFGRFITETTGEIRVNCPQCESRVGKTDTTYKLYINPTKEVYHCFRCGYKGRNLRLLGIDVDNSPSSTDLSSIFDFTEMKLDNPLKPTLRKEKEQKLLLPEEFSTNFYCKEGAPYLKYLHGRGISDTAIQKFKIGYCPSGEYANMVVVPVFEDKRLTFFVGRDIRRKFYKNPKAHKAERIFNLTQNTNLIMCEGVFDALNCGTFAIAIFGKDISNVQLNKIGLAKPKSVTILFDNDAQKDAIRAAKKLKEVVSKVYIAQPVDGKKDAGEMSPSEVMQSLRSRRKFTTTCSIEDICG